MPEGSASRVPAISVSNNFQTLPGAIAQRSPSEQAELRELYSTRFRAIFPRDPASLDALQRQQTADATTETALGLDAAFLLDRHPEVRQDAGIGAFVTFFGRSLKDHGNALIERAGAATGLEHMPLGKWFGIRPPLVDFKFDRMRRRLSRSAFVLTDTYHVAVNAMAEGAPVVGVGIRADSQVGTLGDFKKQQLFCMFGLDAHYVALAGPEEIPDAGAALAAAIETARLQRSGAYGQLHDMRADYVARLTRAIGER